MNHGEGSVIGQLTPVTYNRLTVSDTVSSYEPAGGQMEMKDYRNSARGHLIALENKGAMECYLEKNDTGHGDKAKSIWNLSYLRNARGNSGSIGDFALESSSTTSL